MLVLSHIQAQDMLSAQSRDAAGMEISLDLGLSLVSVLIEPRGVRLLDGGCLTWESISAITGDKNGCYLLEQTPGVSEIPGVYDSRKIQLYSELTGRAYSLYPTSGAPTMLVSGLPMHRIKDTDPYRDTLEKIRAARPVGNVLDTCTGLGYTAIEASKPANVAHVTTIELDPAALQICRSNPWSRALFDNPKITQIIGDSFDEIAKFPDGAFTRIIHDPPYFSLAGDLYALEFYRQACRVLSRNGRLFHYIGDPESKSGRSATAGVIKRLEQAGFRHVERAPRAFGVVASKGF
jgi:predicted methyltransferase